MIMTIFDGQYHNPPKLKLMHTLPFSITVANKLSLKEKIHQVSGFIDLATRIHTESFLPYLTGQVDFKETLYFNFLYRNVLPAFRKD